VRTGVGEARPHQLLDGTVRFGDRREVGLGLDDEIGGTETTERDGVGGVGERVREREVGGEVGDVGEVGAVGDARECSPRAPRRRARETGAMEARPVASSVDELVAGATRRTPLTFADSKSGARFESVERDGERFVLKHIDPHDDWIMRQVGDVGCVPVRLWETGAYDLLPACIDHATVGAAREGSQGAVLMRDVGEWLVPEGDDPIEPDAHLRFLDHLAQLHASTWGWRDTLGLVPLAHRYSFFGPAALACEAAAGFPTPVPRIASEGWRRLDDASPELAAALRPLRTEPWALFDALDDTPTALLHGDVKLGNVGSGPDGRTILVDWSMTGAGPPLAELVHQLALNRARIPSELARDVTVDAYRAALERHGVDTAPWFDRQLALCTVGAMLLLGWEKAFDEGGDELRWWRDRTVDTAKELVRA
jgi:hypothetical protein